MQFKNVQQSVFCLEDIGTLLETIKIETKQNIAICHDLELHAQRLYTSIKELGFNIACSNIEDFKVFLQTQIKNKLQYFFSSPVLFHENLINKEIGLNKTANIFKLRLLYQKNSEIEISISKYQRDLEKTWQIKVLDKKEFHIEATNPIWRYKFYPRPDFSFYFNQGYDELIWTDENDNICEGSFSAIIYDNNKSPLANTLKSTSLQKQNLVFQKTKKADLKNIYLVNSMIGKKSISICELSEQN